MVPIPLGKAHASRILSYVSLVQVGQIEELGMARSRVCLRALPLHHRHSTRLGETLLVSEVVGRSRFDAVDLLAVLGSLDLEDQGEGQCDVVTLRTTSLHCGRIENQPRDPPFELLIGAWNPRGAGHI